VNDRPVNHEVLFLKKLPSDEGSQEGNDADKEANDTTALLGICFSSILQRTNVESKQADPESCNHKVKL
jgi:hypothetical protein